MTKPLGNRHIGSFKTYKLTTSEQEVYDGEDERAWDYTLEDIYSRLQEDLDNFNESVYIVDSSDFIVVQVKPGLNLVSAPYN